VAKAGKKFLSSLRDEIDGPCRAPADGYRSRMAAEVRPEPLPDLLAAPSVTQVQKDRHIATFGFMFWWRATLECRDRF